MFADSNTERLKFFHVEEQNVTMIQALAPALPSLPCPLEIICPILGSLPVLSSELVWVSLAGCDQSNGSSSKA